MVSNGRAFPRAQIGIVMVKYNFDAPGRCVRCVTFQAGYPGIKGDIVVMGVKSGKSVEVGEIASTGSDGTIVKELQGVNWGDEFLRDLGKGDQKIFIRLTEIINLFMPPGYIQE